MCNKTSIILLFLFSSLYGYGQFKSGFILSGGKGSISNVVFIDPYADLEKTVNIEQQYCKYKFDATLGYKFRIAPQNKPVFYDIDLYVGLRRFNTGFTANGEIFPSNGDSYELVNEEWHKQHDYLSFSLNPSWNYRLVKGLYAGVGIEPTMYRYRSSMYMYKRWKFDLPLTAKIGYYLKFIDFSVSYKHGFFDTMNHNVLEPAKFRNWQLSVFIPF